jgi:hypothetical protein
VRTPSSPDSWVLAPASDPTTFFHSDEDLYATVEDQAKLIALIDTTESDAYIRSFFKKKETP